MRYGHCRTAASIHAFTAGQATLLTGELDCLAGRRCRRVPALYSPDRAEHGELDPAVITAALV